MQSKISKAEKTSFEEGNLLVLESNGQPLPYNEAIWFVWYRLKDNKYKVLLKSFTTKKELAQNKLKAIKRETSQYGIGKLDMKTGKWVFYKSTAECCSE